jgi:chorismate mutase-like protein
MGVASAIGAEVGAPGVLRIGTPGDYAPYSWRDDTIGDYRGADIEWARALALRLGLRAEFVPTTWTALVADAAAGRFDIAVGGISITAEREKVVAFSAPYARDQKQPVVRCGEQRQFDTAAEINQPQVRLIVNPGGTNERFVRERFPGAALTVHADNRSVFDEILARRADVMVTDAVEARLQQRAGKGLCMARVSERWAPARKAVLLAPQSPLQMQIDAALRNLGGARRYQQALSNWEAYRWADADQPLLRLAALIDERLAIVTEVARAKWNTQAAIEDPVREQALLESLRQRASGLGLPAVVADRFFGAQIEAAKVLQRELFATWRRERRGQFDGAADLARDIRPQIDRVTARMLEQLALLAASSPQRLPVASTLSLISPAALRTARGPLLRAGT